MTEIQVQIKWEMIRKLRDKLLSDAANIIDRHRREREMIAIGVTDTTTLSDDKILEYYLYIQELCDIPQKFSNPDEVVFPNLP